MKWISFLSVLFLLAACGSSDEPTAQPEAFTSPETSGLTYSDDILPIIEVRCAPCHNESSGIPNWLDYEQVIQKKARIRERVFVLKDMPFQNQTNMNDEERALFAKWINQGAAF